ncbi:hypothetical protein KC324_g5345 [Hortaea werneckii]|nr:hypothetical protein KC324_g5345 [Hortaea werneckii]
MLDPTVVEFAGGPLGMDSILDAIEDVLLEPTGEDMLEPNIVEFADVPPDGTDILGPIEDIILEPVREGILELGIVEFADGPLGTEDGLDCMEDIILEPVANGMLELTLVEFTVGPLGMEDIVDPIEDPIEDPMLEPLGGGIVEPTLVELADVALGIDDTLGPIEEPILETIDDGIPDATVEVFADTVPVDMKLEPVGENMLEPVIEGGTVAILVVLADTGVETNDEADDTMDELAGPMEFVVTILDIVMEPTIDPVMEEGRAVPEVVFDEVDAKEDPVEAGGRVLTDEELELSVVMEDIPEPFDVDGKDDCMLEPKLEPMPKLEGRVAVVVLAGLEVDINEEPKELVREPMLDPMLELGGGVAVVELAAGDVAVNEEPIELVIDAMLEPLLELDGGMEIVEFAVPGVDMNEEPIELPEDAMLEPMLRLDAPGEVDERGINDPIEEAGLDVIEDPEAGVVVLATLLVVKDEAIELTADEDLVLALTKDEPVGAGVTAVVLMLLGVEVDMNEEPTELVEIEEPGKVFPVDDPLGEETGIDEFAALVELDVEA